MLEPKRPAGVRLCLACAVSAAAVFAQGGMTTGGRTGQPIIVSGKVEMADGTPLPDRVEMELVCQGQVQSQGKTDLEGGFNFQLGINRYEGASNASTGSSAAGTGFGGSLSGQSQVDGASVMALIGCTLRAVLPGYQSETVDLSRRRAGDSSNIGTIVLRKLGQVQGTTVSVTSLNSPNEAKKALERGREQIGKGRLEDAEKELTKAVQLYPKFAEAWVGLGAVLQTQKKLPEARKAYLEAVAADPQYTQPYLNLARLSAIEQNWQDAIEKSATLLRLNPYEFPQAYYFNAVAHYNLQNFEKAQESATQAVRLDTAHTVPLAHQLLGVLLARNGDFAGAAEQVRAYIQYAPPTANLEPVKQMLAEFEGRIPPGRN